MEREADQGNGKVAFGGNPTAPKADTVVTETKAPSTGEKEEAPKKEKNAKAEMAPKEKKL